MALICTLPATCLPPQRIAFPRCFVFPFRRRVCESYLCSVQSNPFHISSKASRRITNTGRNGLREHPGGGGGRGNFEGEEDFIQYDDSDEEDDEDDEDRSLDLLARFIQNVFKKISKRARKATASILPSAISPQLVAFSVDGVIILTSLSIVKAFLEVVCMLGSVVFGAILLVRLIWSAVTYMQMNGKNINIHGNDGDSSYSTLQPAA